MSDYFFFDRDLSWLSFNERVLMEAEKDAVPVLEKINFLSIFSSNLDEFYRVRMPAIILKQQTKNADENTGAGSASLYAQVTAYINRQLRKFDNILTQQVIPKLKQNNIHLVYGGDIPLHIKKNISAYFFTQVLSFIQPVKLSKHTDFFFE